MKYLILLTGFGLGILWGIFPGIDKHKPTYWKIIAIILVAGSLIFSLLPPVSGHFKDAVQMHQVGSKDAVPVKTAITGNSGSYREQGDMWEVIPHNIVPERARIIVPTENLPSEFKKENQLVISVKYDGENFIWQKTVSKNPLLTFPFVPNLGERIRNLNLHVPMAWISVLAYLISMIFSIKYLKDRQQYSDVKAMSAASVGLLFTFVTTVTGMIWAKYNWGSYWNWDPRETSIFVLLLIYAAYFALRSAIQDQEKRSRLSAVYSILAFVTVPFFVFILPRITEGLHPGSKDDASSGPVMDSDTSTLSGNMLIAFSLALCAFTILFFWILSLKIRTEKIHNKLGIKLF